MDGASAGTRPLDGPLIKRMMRGHRGQGEEAVEEALEEAVVAVEVALRAWAATGAMMRVVGTTTSVHPGNSTSLPRKVLLFQRVVRRRRTKPWQGRSLSTHWTIG
jgi:hypothetical protein